MGMASLCGYLCLVCLPRSWFLGSVALASLTLMSNVCHNAALVLSRSFVRRLWLCCFRSCRHLFFSLCLCIFAMLSKTVQCNLTCGWVHSVSTDGDFRILSPKSTISCIFYFLFFMTLCFDRTITGTAN